MRNGIALLVLAAYVSFACTTAQATTAVGRTPGQFAVTPFGAAQYSIPIWSAPGPHGVQPHIALTYNSQQGNGYVGVGWGVSGLSSIYRCNLTIAQDGAGAPVALATSDGYCMDGQRLRLTAGTYGTAGSTYQTEIANFVNVTAQGAAGNGPGYWTATDRNGWQYTYGEGGTTSNAQVLASGSTTADSWQLNEVKDPNGNTMTITYLTSNVVGVVVPHIISWVPASYGSSTYNETMTFNYGTTGSVHGYVGGTPFNNTNILSSIAIAYQGTPVKTYYLTYSNTLTATSRYLLTQVQECAGTGTSNCLSPTSVSWQAGAAGLEAGTALSGTVGTVLSTAYDLNGDGRNDLVMTTSAGAVLVAFGGSSGYGTPVATGLSNSGGLLVGDIDGSGTASLLVDVSGTWSYYKWNGSSFVGTSTGISVASTPGALLADVDGDGRADFLYTGSDGDVYVRLNTSMGGTVSFASAIDSGVTMNVGVIAQIGGSNRALHFWGSAQADLLGEYKICTQYKSGTDDCQAWEYSNYAMHFTGSTFALEPLYSNVTSSPPPVVDFADYNDDGCTDVLTTTQLFLSACNGTSPISVPLPSGVTAVGGMDWNGDGRRDVLVAQSNGDLGVVLSTGTGLSSTVISTTASTSISYTAAPNLTGDGQDGLIGWNGTSATVYLHNSPSAPPDLLTSVTDGYGNFVKPSYVSIAQNYYSPMTNATYPYENYIGPIYAVYNVVFNDASQTSGTWYQGFWYAGAWSNLQGRGFAGFLAMQTYDSRTTLWETWDRNPAFPYTGMVYYDILAQTNLEAGPIRIYSATPQSMTLSSTDNQERYFPYIGSSTQKTYELGGSENGDPSTTTSTSYTYDSYGNATNIVKIVTDTDPGSPYPGDTWTTNLTNTPDVDTTHWCLGLLTEKQVAYSASVGSSVTRTKTFTPNTTTCQYTQIVTEPTANGGFYKVTEGLTYDSFGNIATDTITGANMPSSPASRETQLNWGTTGQFLSYSIDPSGAKTSWTYTSNQAVTFGVPDSMKNANNLTTAWLYDGFGRKTQETRPDNTYTTWVYNDCATYGGCILGSNALALSYFLYSTNGVIQSDGTTYFDTVDRPLMVNKLVISGYNRNEVRYDSLGRVAQQAMPCVYTAVQTPCTYWATNSYDVLNRLLSVTRPISSTNSTTQSTNYAYAGRTTTITDPKGNTKTTVTDVNGWLRQTKDAIGYKITRAFDSAGSLIGVTDSVGNTLLSNVSVVYGIKPFVTAATDADRGAWTYTIDSLGERTKWTDAKGQSFLMTYDALSRPLSRTEPDLFTEWNYGSTAPSIGQLTSECSQLALVSNLCNTGSWLYNETRNYDSLGRPQYRSIAENGITGNDTNPVTGVGGVFLYTLTYSATTGFPSTLTYPTSTSGTGSALTVQYGYTNAVLSSVTDSSDLTGTCGTTCVLWTANAINPRGQVTQETLGNDVVTNRSYDAVTSWLTVATAGVGGGASLLNQSYLQDENGNVTERQDGVHSLTENFYYDADNRLCDAVVGGTGSCTSPTIVYDGGSAGPGNITTQTGVGTYTYPTAGQPHPHAVSSITGTFNGITNPAFTYDLNGNMVDRASTGQNIYWYSSNYPLSISGTDTTGSEEVQFQYGPDRQRWQQVYTGPSATETTYYVGNGDGPAPAQLEVVINGGITTYRYYINAGSEPIAVYSRSSSGTNAMNYMLEDHQGGVSSFASNAGALDIDESFSAFGQRRNPSTWSGAPLSGDLTTIAGLSRQGYTFQTWLGQSMGLNHMNGRVEDAILGRMISPDPHITDPTNAQSYNRYSYVNNNPLTLIDPTGFDAKECPSDGTCPVGGGVGGLPEQGDWSCYGNCSGGGYANTPPTALTPGQVQALQNYIAQNSSGIQSSNGGGGNNNSAASIGTDSTVGAQSGGCSNIYVCQDAGQEPNAAVQVLNGYTTGPDNPGSFSCGGGTCTYHMGTYDNPEWGQNGVYIQVTTNDTGAWVQTYTRDSGSPVYDNANDPSNSLYTGYGTTASVFKDTPGINYGTGGTFTAQTTFVVPNSSGGYTPVFTFGWSAQQLPGGVTFTTPVIVSPNSFQWSAIVSAYHQ